MPSSTSRMRKSFEAQDVWPARVGNTVTAMLRTLLARETRARDRAEHHVVDEINALVAEVRENMPAEWRGRSSKEIMDSMYDDAEPDGFAR